MPSFFQTYGGALYRMYCQLEERSIAPESTDPLTRLSAKEAAKKIREGKLSSYELVKAYLDRIRFVNTYVNAVTESFDVEALEEAKKVDEYIKSLDKGSEEYKNLAHTKPLLGVPVSIKHSFDVKGYRNIAGLAHRRDIPIATEDADAVKLIRAAGGIPHCYSNVPPGCMWVETNNKVHGTTSSPYDTRTTCGGSSGGEGSVISAEGSVVGLGSDLGGSVRIPAILNGVFGLKSVDEIPLKGHYPTQGCEDEGFRQLAQAGPLVRYAEDMAAMFSVLSSYPIPSNFVDLRPTKVLQTMPTSSITTPRVPVVQEAVPKVAKAISSQFGVPLEEFDLPPLKQIMSWYFNEIAKPDMASPGECLLPHANQSNLVIEKIKAFIGVSKITPGPTSIIDPFGTPLPKEQALKLRQELHEYRAKLHEILKDDVVMVAPTLARNYYFHHELVIAQVDWFQTAIFNVLAVPVATVPIGLDSEGYPISVQLVAARKNEFLLIRLQEHMEKKFGGWRPPKN
ncbi:unnamed protein product [Bursaphelenchus xylophilus]|uniref:(pine wood nematode) hypothetical protein n=1 Tax=Bursaphelenchus xylophilus TaxID=6326 RepID=A0A1I7SKZ7_BURXY|nr:unnamed protein product [Bursaphelenchus xylophilus]CAG9129312.1 unnamed protein product [Bursaphelenchus xylophilus]